MHLFVFAGLYRAVELSWLNEPALQGMGPLTLYLRNTISEIGRHITPSCHDYMLLFVVTNANKMSLCFRRDDTQNQAPFTPLSWILC